MDDQLSKRPIEFVQKSSFLSASLKSPTHTTLEEQQFHHQQQQQQQQQPQLQQQQQQVLFQFPTQPQPQPQPQPQFSSSVPTIGINLSSSSFHHQHQQPQTLNVLSSSHNEMIVENANLYSTPSNPIQLTSSSFVSLPISNSIKTVDIPKKGERKSERLSAFASPKPYTTTKKKKSISMSCDREDDFLRTTIDRRNLSDPKEYITRRGRRNAVTSLMEPRSTPIPSLLSRSPSDWTLFNKRTSEETSYHGNNNTSTPLGTSVEEKSIHDPVFQLKVDECENLFNGVHLERE